MTKIQLMILGAIGVIGVVAYFTFRRQPAYNPNVRTPFGNGYPSPPIGTSLASQRPGPPVSPIPGTVGRVIQETQTGIDAVGALAKDLKTTIGSIKDLFN